VRDASIVVNGITEYQQALSAWERRTVVNPLEVSPGPRDTHYVVVQLDQLQPFYQNHRLDYILL
jgi:hypothetical protein